MKKISIILFLGILGFVFYKFGRSIYIPAINKLKGKETVESIADEIQNDVWDRLETNLNLAGHKMDYPDKIILVAFKEEQKLQVYSNDYNGIKLIKEYPFTAFSGKLGPKLKEGDKQIPEGIYKVEYLNPNSSYYLSIKVNYPNEFDKSKTKLVNQLDLGGDIFIHGKAVTIGCIPVGDKAIEEIFVLTSKAIKNEVKVIISPRDFRVNSTYPEIDEIDWENELYDLINKELKTLPNNAYDVHGG
ncbi:MAG: murein L,D-transpeptidase family protein [Sediminibacterium sp.]